MKRDNLLERIPAELPEELFETLLERPGLRLERIVSDAHVTPPGSWYDQDRSEWVLLLSGRARLRFEGEQEATELQPGDWLLIPAHRRHRVEETSTDEKTVWLALHFDEQV